MCYADDNDIFDDVLELGRDALENGKKEVAMAYVNVLRMLDRNDDPLGFCSNYLGRYDEDNPCLACLEATYIIRSQSGVLIAYACPVCVNKIINKEGEGRNLMVENLDGN